VTCGCGWFGGWSMGAVSCNCKLVFQHWELFGGEVTASCFGRGGVCLFVCLFVCLCARPYLCPSTHPSVCRSCVGLSVSTAGVPTGCGV
jgi:hypothetical protein